MLRYWQWSKHQLAVISHFNNYVLHLHLRYILVPREKHIAGEIWQGLTRGIDKRATLVLYRFCRHADENKRQKVALILDKLITMTIDEVEVGF